MSNHTLHVIDDHVYYEAKRTHPTHRPHLVHVCSVADANDPRLVEQQIAQLHNRVDALNAERDLVSESIRQWNAVRDAYRPANVAGVVAPPPIDNVDDDHDDVGGAMSVEQYADLNGEKAARKYAPDLDDD